MKNENSIQNNSGCLFAFLQIFFDINPKKKPAEEHDYSNAYQKKYLLTKNEWYAHKKLKSIADSKGYILCPKVRLLDIVEPRTGEKDWKVLFNKIQSKHVDFVICDQGMKILGILELDDNTHNRSDRQQRDAFVDQVLSGVGYKVIHTRSITDDILDVLELPQESNS